MTKKIIKIEGMHCASCAMNISKNLNKQSGVQSAEVNYATKKAEVEYDSSQIDAEQLRKTIVDSGYTPLPEPETEINHTHEHRHIKTSNLKKQVMISALLTFPLALRMFWMWEFPGTFLGIPVTKWVIHDLSFLVVFIFGWRFHISAFKQLKKFQFSMDSLISLGTLAAYSYSTWAMFNGGHLYFDSAATITTLILLGKYFEEKSTGKASSAMQKLMELGASHATIFLNGHERTIDIKEVRVDDILIIKPGEKIPIDGVIVDGISTIDESMLTGESLPVTKKIYNIVYGGTMNIQGVIKIKVTSTGADTMLAQIIKTVEEAQKFKAPIQKLADKISSIFVPVVIVVAIFTFLGWYFYSGVFSTSLIHAVTVLVIACPCALGLATPIAVMVGTSVGARKGILIKNGESFEKAKNIDTIVFDKTGTLTEGKPFIEKIIINNQFNYTENKILKIAASLSKNSKHPISQAAIHSAEAKNLQLAEIKNFQEIVGKGISGQCVEHNTLLLFGSIKLLKENKKEIVFAEKVLDDYKNHGGTVNFVSHDDHVIGALVIKDEIKKSAKETIERLKELNIEPIMLSGDNKFNAKAVADEIGINNYLAEILPNEKQLEVKKLQDRGKNVIFVGDGINDAPSLVQANLGIAMASGTDIAKEAGNIIIIKNDPLKVVEAVILSRKTFDIIKQNLFWAFFYNVLAIPLAIAGVITPMIGAAAMSFSSISVILNSLRIYKK